ncbi:MAG: molybdopterin biosynthesis protein [Planctomycetaceae bacterium]
MTDPTLRAARQQQFLDVVSRDEAVARFQEHLRLEPLGSEPVPLAAALGRVLAADVVSPVDVSGFDRSNVDGFAVRSSDTIGASEERPRSVALNAEVVAPGAAPEGVVEPETATTIATGAMIPRGADAVVMVEDTDVLVEGRGSRVEGNASLDPQPSTLSLFITRAVSPGQNITFAGTDIAMGETVLRAGRLVTSREIGVLAAIGCETTTVVRKPRVAVISTGNEIVPPGEERPPGFVYDSNLAIISAAIEELGGEPVRLGVVRDDERQLQSLLQQGLQYDAVVLSGGTSKGAGDLSYRVVERLQNPGVVVHGAALKPGKPICLAVTDGKPVVILPGFPTSAVFTFHEFVAPVLRCWAGRREQLRGRVRATVPLRINSERGRTEFALVALFRGGGGLSAYSLGKGSGSVTTYSSADGFITIDAQTEIVEAGSEVDVQLLAEDVEPADLVVIGSHCVGLDILLGEMERSGFRTKVMHVGSTGGLNAAKRGECDLSGVHLLDAETGEYNRPFLNDDVELIPGYGRMQGIVYRAGDSRFEGQSVDDALAAALADSDCRMINRNAGSGTRILIDGLLEGREPPGYAVQAKSHNAVAAAVSQRRGDWGLAIEAVAAAYGLSFLPVREERYDFVSPRSRGEREAVRAFRALLHDGDVRARLAEAGFPS